MKPTRLGNAIPDVTRTGRCEVKPSTKEGLAVMCQNRSREISERNPIFQFLGMAVLDPTQMEIKRHVYNQALELRKEIYLFTILQ